MSASISSSASKVLRALSKNGGQQPSLFSTVPATPEDPMFGLSAAYRADTFPQKVDLGVGAYRDENAKPWILPSVIKASEQIKKAATYNHEYLPIAGFQPFLTASANLIFGENSRILQENRVATAQTLSGTGALHLGAALLATYAENPATKTVHLSNPPYVNHPPIFRHAGLLIESYPYYKPSTRSLDINALLARIKQIPENSTVVLHACAHNPTGVDPSREDWQRIAALVKEKNHIPFFDFAYQGFATGDAEADAWPIRHFISIGIPNLLIAQSFAKNFGLYGERAGALHVVTSSADIAEKVLGQMKRIQRVEISTPPAHGARLVAEILADDSLNQLWRRDVSTMAERIKSMRAKLRELLEGPTASGGQGQVGAWKHLTEQIGMFCYSGLNEEQVKILREKHHIYLTRDGRISVSGLNNGNVGRVAQAIGDVTGRGLGAKI